MSSWSILIESEFSSIIFISASLARSETSTRCRPGNGFLGLANIWSRLMKHNWWNSLYGRIRTHLDVFLILHSTKIHLCTTISIVRRPNFSSCMRMINNYDFYFIVVDRFFFFWTGEDRSYRNHQRKLIIIDLSGPRENQNTVERNGFYEWGIWRTIMRTMSENSFICIKINSWLR